MPDAIVERDGHLLVVTLNRPQRMNALSGEMLVRMYDAWVEASTDDDIRCILLTGAGCNFCSGADLRAMAGDVTRAARGILPGNRLDALVFGCTSGTVAIGSDEVTRLLRVARPGIPCTNPIDAALAAFAALGARRISVLTPYTVPVNQAIAAHLAAAGVEVLSITGFDLEGDDEMTAVPPAATAAAAAECCHPAADLLFVSCTALRVAEVLDQIEDRLGRPVVASNQALLWHALRLIGNEDAIAGFGRLLTLPLADRPGECR